MESPRLRLNNAGLYRNRLPAGLLFAVCFDYHCTFDSAESTADVTDSLDTWLNVMKPLRCNAVRKGRRCEYITGQEVLTYTNRTHFPKHPQCQDACEVL